MGLLDDVGEAKAAALRSERDRWKNLHDKLAVQNHELQEKYDLVRAVTSEPLDPPKWTAPKRTKKYEAIVTAILSDCHFDEVVNPDEIGGANEYDRQIATERLERFGHRLIEHTAVPKVNLNGLVLMIGGDLISGNLHDLAETNEGHMPETVVYWSERLAALLSMLADHFGSVHCPVVVGNHGRLTKKPRTKGRARDNIDWLIPQIVAGYLKNDVRISWQIPDDPDCFVQVYDTTYLLTHGDQVKGGGGIGGIWPPIMRMNARKQERYAREFVTVMGHWHKLIMAPGQGLIVNGSLKGYDEYAAVNNFKFERPQQAAWLTTPENGPTTQIPIFVD